MASVTTVWVGAQVKLIMKIKPDIRKARVKVPLKGLSQNNRAFAMVTAWSAQKGMVKLQGGGGDQRPFTRSC